MNLDVEISSRHIDLFIIETSKFPTVRWEKQIFEATKFRLSVEINRCNRKFINVIYVAECNEKHFPNNL